MATTLPVSWEDHLLTQELADHSYKAVPGATNAICSTQTQRAYSVCAQITSRHLHFFPFVTARMPPAKRQALQALFALYQTGNVLVNVRKDPDAFEAWRWHLLLSDPADNDPVQLAWTDTSRRFTIPPGYVRQLLHGLGQDLRPPVLENFDELAGYAYGIAATLALISLQIIGYAGAEAIPYAISLGVALRITRILCDVNADWSAGRVYLPRAEMGQFGVSLANLNDGRVTDQWRAFMRFQIARNRELYADAWPGIAWLPPEGRFAAVAVIDHARALLDDIEAHDYDVFSRQAHLSTAATLRRFPALWRQSRQWATTAQPCPTKVISHGAS